MLGSFGLFLAYLAVMWVGFAADGLVLPVTTVTSAAGADPTTRT